MMLTLGCLIKSFSFWTKFLFIWMHLWEIQWRRKIWSEMAWNGYFLCLLECHRQNDQMPNDLSNSVNQAGNDEWRFSISTNWDLSSYATYYEREAKTIAHSIHSFARAHISIMYSIFQKCKFQSALNFTKKCALAYLVLIKDWSNLWCKFREGMQKQVMICIVCVHRLRRYTN